MPHALATCLLQEYLTDTTHSIAPSRSCIKILKELLFIPTLEAKPVCSVCPHLRILYVVLPKALFLLPGYLTAGGFYSWLRGRSANIEALRGLPPAQGILLLPSAACPIPIFLIPLILLCIVIVIGTIRMHPQATSLRFALSPTQFWAYCKCPTIGRSDLMPLDPMPDKCP